MVCLSRGSFLCMEAANVVGWEVEHQEFAEGDSDSDTVGPEQSPQYDGSSSRDSVRLSKLGRPK